MSPQMRRKLLLMADQWDAWQVSLDSPEPWPLTWPVVYAKEAAGVMRIAAAEIEQLEDDCRYLEESR